MEISVRPISSINDSFSLIVENLDPFDLVRIKVEAYDATGTMWQQETEFSANGEGIVDTDHSLPLNAAWAPASSLGLMWTLSPERTHAFALSGDKPLSVDLKVRSSSGGRGTHIQRSIARNIDSDESGHIFSPQIGAAPLAVLFNDAGLEAPTTGAALLAGIGMRAIAYEWQEKNSIADIAQDIRDSAAHELVKKEEPITLIGIGKGAELALLLAQHLGDKVGPVIAHNAPDHITASMVDPDESCWKEYAPQSQPIKKIDLHARAREATLKGKAVDLGGLIAPQEGAHIPVDKIVGPVLLTASTHNAVWDSVSMTQRVEKLLEDSGVQVFRMLYEEAGHGVGYPFSLAGVPAATTAQLWGMRTDLGGSRIINNQCSQDSREQVESLLSSYYGL